MPTPRLETPNAPVRAVLSPHLDDAVLGAWSALRGPGEVRVVNICTAVPAAGVLSAWDERTGATDSAARMRERLLEDSAALARAGRRSVGLGFLEVQYRSGPPSAGELRDAIGAATQDAGEVWAPAGIGEHPDHVLVRDAALALARASGPPLRLYAELPYSAGPGGWPQRFASQLVELGDEEAERKLAALREYSTQFAALDRDGCLTDPRVNRREASWPQA